mgnify:CR=1 FL=1
MAHGKKLQKENKKVLYNEAFEERKKRRESDSKLQQLHIILWTYLFRRKRLNAGVHSCINCFKLHRQELQHPEHGQCSSLSCMLKNS